VIDSFTADLDALARVGAGPEWLDDFARQGMPPGAFSTFMSLEQETRHLVLKLLAGDVSEETFAELEAHPACASLSRWVLTLPAYANAPVFDPDDEETW
jgi:hypothetical protein